jgi:hypothetical protein
MIPLYVRDKPVETVFDLLGQRENDMTFAVGWALAQSAQFAKAIAAQLGFADGFSDRVRIRLQEHKSALGFTDIEIEDPGGLCLALDPMLTQVVPGYSEQQARLRYDPQRPLGARRRARGTTGSPRRTPLSI